MSLSGKGSFKAAFKCSVKIRSKKQFDHKRSSCKVGAMEGVVAEEINTIRKKPSTLHWENRKDALRASQID